MVFPVSSRTVASFFILLTSISASKPSSQPMGWTINTYPSNPNDARCGGHGHDICDPDRILEKDKVKELGDLIKLVEKESCACGKCEPLQKATEDDEGFKIGIAAMNKLRSEGSGNLTWEQIDIDAFADEMMKIWSLGNCRNGLIIALSNETEQYAVAFDQTTLLRLQPECLKKRPSIEAERLIKQGKHVEGLKVLILKYKKMIKDGSCLMSRTIWLVVAFTLAPAGIVFAVCYLACKSSNYVIKTARAKRVKQMMHKKLEEYSTSRTSSESCSSSEDGRGCSTSGQYRSIGEWKSSIPSVSHDVTQRDAERGEPISIDNTERERRYSDVWVKAIRN